MDRTLSGATTLDQCWPKSDDNEGVLHIFQSSSITGNLTIRLFSGVMVKAMDYGVVVSEFDLQSR